MNSTLIRSLPIFVIAGVLFAACATTGGGYGAKEGGKLSVEYACPVCDTDYLTEADWKQHVKAHHPRVGKAPIARAVSSQETGKVAVEYTCPVCDTDYVTAAEWKEHVKAHHGAGGP